MRWRHRGRRCWSSRRRTSARWPPPAPPACASCRCPPTPTASSPNCWPAPSRRPGAHVCYPQPLHANPTGATLAAARRRRCSTSSPPHRALLIEDDWCRDLSFEKAPPRPLIADDRHGHCVYLRSLTKSTAPGLRIGAIVARGAALARLTASRVGRRVLRLGADAGSGARGRPRPGVAAPPAAAARDAGRQARRAGQRGARPLRRGQPGAACRPAGCTCGCGCPTRSTPRTWPGAPPTPR